MTITYETTPPGNPLAERGGSAYRKQEFVIELGDRVGVHLQVRTLGRLQLSLDDQPLTEAVPAKVAGLIVYLAESGVGHSRSELAGLLWSDLPEDAARSNLRQALTRLRRALPDHLEVHRDSVALTGQVWIDTGALGTAEGKEVAELYRGDFLAGFEPAGAELFIEWASARRAVHRTTALAALEREVATALAEGRVADGIAAARRILEIEPHNESAHASLMRLFLAEGQPAAALAQFETCRHVLMEELGETPGEQTQQIAAKARRSSPSVTRTAGAQRVSPPPTSFIGRERELERIDELLGAPDCRILSIVGQGGAGKTRLAIEVAARLGERGRDAIVVPLHGLVAPTPERAADLVIAEIMRSFELTVPDRRDPLDHLIDRLARRNVVIVLDNFEHLLGASPVVATLAARLDNLRLLITTRRRLGIGSEWVLELSGLDFPPPGAPGDLTRFPAVALFTDRLGATPDSPPPRNLDAIVRITRLVEGLPLAIELAASRARSIPAEEIAERLRADLDVLAGGAPDVPERHRSMRSVLDWSWQLLSEDAKSVLAACSVFRGRFDLGAADAVTGASSIAAMEELVALSLVSLDRRFELHELVRAYAEQRLAENPAEQALVRERHARHFADRLSAGWESDDLEDLRAATSWLIEHADASLLRDHLERLWDVQREIGAYAEARSVLEAALRRKDVHAIDRAEWHLAAGRAQLQIGAYAPSRKHLIAGIQTLNSSFPRSKPMTVAKLMVQIARQALPLRGRSRSAARRSRAMVRSRCLGVLGETAYFLELPAQVGLCAVWALNEAEVSGDKEEVVVGQSQTALMAAMVGWHRMARRYATKVSRAGASHTGDGSRVPYALMVDTLVWLTLAEWANVESDGARALEGVRRAREPRMEEQLLLMQAIALLVRGRYEDVLAPAGEVLDLARPRGALWTQQWGHLLTAEAAFRLGDLDRAESHALAAGRIVDRTHERLDAARVEAVLARVAAARNDTVETLQRLVRARSLFQGVPIRHPWGFEAQAAPLEIVLDLVEGGFDGPEVRGQLEWATELLAGYARVLPMARPRHHLLVGRVAALHGHEAAARREFRTALQLAEQTDAAWDADQARRRLNLIVRT